MNFYRDFWHSYDPDVNDEVQASMGRIKDAEQTEWPPLEPGTPAYNAMHNVPAEDTLLDESDINMYMAEYGLDGLDLNVLNFYRHLVRDHGLVS